MSKEPNNPTSPMTASEYFDYRHSTEKFPFNGSQLLFAEAYAAYRLQFEREQQQQSWMPTEEEWKRFPEAKCAAMDYDGEVYTFSCDLEELAFGNACWLGEHPYYVIKTVDPTNLNWRQCKVARPEGV